MKRGTLAAVIPLMGFAMLASAAQAPAELQATVVRQAPVTRRAPDGDATATIRVESRFVNVALNVVDEHGSPVGGLTVDDFEIAEDGAPQKIAIFEKESSTPLEIVLVLDTSGSVLTDEKLEQSAARSFVKSLVRPQDLIDLMTFADGVDELVGFTSDTHRIDSGLGRLVRGDATALYDAVYLASQRLAEAPARVGKGEAAAAPRRVIVVISDGENTTRHGSYDAALEQAERAGAMVYALIVVPIASDAGRNTGGEHALIQMANDTGGKFYYVVDKHDLAPAFEHVSDDLRTQYTLGYYAPQKGKDSSGLRHIHMQLKDPSLRAKYTLRYRTAYYGR